MLAVGLKVLIPAGFMVAPSHANDLPFELVICTGEGAKVIAPGGALDRHGDEAPGKESHDTPCPFSGQAVGAPPPSPIVVAEVEFVGYRAPAPSRHAFDPVPGRGLSAPPLPARGPPVLSI